MIDYRYLTPPSRVNKIKLPANYQYENVNGKHVRRIFAHSAYETFEREAILNLKEYLKKKAPNIYYPDELLLRFNYLGNFLLSEVTEKVKLYDEWHQNELIINLNKMGKEILQYGHIYAYGRDYEYCPVIIIKANKIDLKKYQYENYLNAIANLLEPLQKYMMVGGVIEKWNIITDFQSKKTAPNLDLLLKCINRIINAYPYRLKRLLYLNVHTSNQYFIHQATEIVKNYDPEVHAQVIKDQQTLTKYISTDEREKKYGGSKPNVCEYWPIHTTNTNEQTESNISNTEYESVMNDPTFFEESKAPLCDFSNSKCVIY